MKTIKLYFEDMWGYDQYQFNPHDNYFTGLFKREFNVVIDPDPDVLIYSVFGFNNKNYKCKKIFFCGENAGDNFKHPLHEACDVSMSQFEESDKNIYFPLWCLFVNWFNEQQPKKLPSNPTFHTDVQDLVNPSQHSKTKFCAFINNNPIDNRMKMYELLSSYKKVDSYGNLFNNVGAALRGSEQAKINVLKDYKFTIAFENSYHPGYNTEKIIQPLSVNCIPLYWGGDSIRHYFNMDKIIYANDYAALESVLDKVVELDTNDSLYEKMAKMSSVQPAFYDFKPEKILEKIKNKLQI